MDPDPTHLRRHVLRRVRYATNFLAVEADTVPPEGPFDTALTNALVSIVAKEWPGEEENPKRPELMLPASRLLAVVESNGQLDMVDIASLREGLELTKPFRHGRTDDEFAAITRDHVAALASLDEHHSLRFVDSARGLTLDECVVTAFYQRAEDELPFDLKDRLDTPDPDQCDECFRRTFLRSGWDMFGREGTGGFCIACGHVVTEDVAYQDAVDEAIRYHMNDGT